MRMLAHVNILTVNDDEARMLSGEHNLVRASRAILKMGPDTLLVKRGEYGVLQFSSGSMFAVPAYPLEEVIDPTGAGDTFAGGFMGFLARHGRVNEPILRTAVVYGSVLALAVVGVVLIVVFQDGLPSGVTASIPAGASRPHRCRRGRPIR